MKNSKSVIVKPKALKLTCSIKNATLKLAHSFSTQLIKSAALYSRLSANIEKKHKGKPKGEEISEYKAYVTGAIFTAFSFIEASINELFWAARESKQSDKNLGHKVIETLTAISEKGLQRISPLNRYQIALALARKDLFDKGMAPYQDVYLLRRLRNALIHYEPEWIGDEPQALEKNLKLKFNLSPFFGEGSLFLPHRCLSHGCAKWTVTSCIRFADEFYSKIGLKPKYDNIRSRLKTE